MISTSWSIRKVLICGLVGLLVSFITSLVRCSSSAADLFMGPGRAKAPPVTVRRVS
jgi:hypothetical protein